QVPCVGGQLYTVYDYDYSFFPLGDLSQAQVGSKTPTKFIYYSNGALQNVLAPVPGNPSGAFAWVTATYTYTALGNIATITLPAPNNTPGATVTYTYNYTTDGTYNQAEALSEPLTLTDPRGKVT